MKKRPLTNEERSEIEALRRLWDEKLKWCKLNRVVFTQKIAAELLGLGTQSALSQYLNGIIPLNTGLIISLATLLGCQPSDIRPSLAGTEKRPDIFYKTTHYDQQDISGVPVIEWNETASWFSDNNRVQAISANKWLGCPVPCGIRAYATRVIGDSMASPYESMDFPEGILIFVDPNADVISGKKVIAKLPGDDQPIFRIYREEAGKRLLVPINTRYNIIELEPGVRILGVVIFAGFFV